jgi:hypothetical protein
MRATAASDRMSRQVFAVHLFRLLHRRPGTGPARHGAELPGLRPERRPLHRLCSLHPPPRPAAPGPPTGGGGGRRRRRRRCGPARGSDFHRVRDVVLPAAFLHFRTSSLLLSISCSLPSSSFRPFSVLSRFRSFDSPLPHTCPSPYLSLALRSHLPHLFLRKFSPPPSILYFSTVGHPAGHPFLRHHPVRGGGPGLHSSTRTWPWRCTRSGTWWKRVWLHSPSSPPSPSTTASASSSQPWSPAPPPLAPREAIATAVTG